MTDNGVTTVETEPATPITEQQGFWAALGVLLIVSAVLLAFGPSVDPESEFRHLVESLIAIGIGLLAFGAAGSFRRAGRLGDSRWAILFTTLAWLSYAFLIMVAISTCNSWSAADPIVPLPWELGQA